MLALSVRQPYAELILRGIKTVEYRSRPTRVVGRRFALYASQSRAAWSLPGRRKVWSRDLAAPGADGTAETLPAWMIELAGQVGLIEAEGLADQLPTGVIVGSAVIDRVSQEGSVYRWHLADVQRAAELRKPTRQPQPVWFRAF